MAVHQIHKSSLRSIRVRLTQERCYLLRVLMPLLIGLLFRRLIFSRSRVLAILELSEFHL